MNPTFVCGVTIFEKLVYRGTRDEVKAYSWQLVANAINQPLAGGSSESFSQALDDAADAFVNLEQTPGFANPGYKPSDECNCHCHDDDD